MTDRTVRNYLTWESASRKQRSSLLDPYKATIDSPLNDDLHYNATVLRLGRKACMEGYSAYYMSCQDMVEMLTKARAQNNLKRKLRWLKKPNVLLLDEIGYESLSSEQATLFFQLVATRYEQGSIIMTTNKTFGKWGELLSDDAVATATLDRLLHHAHVLTLKGDSYRMMEYGFLTRVQNPARCWGYTRCGGNTRC